MSLKEVWKPVVGYEGLYEVSSLGRIRSKDRVVNCRNGHKRTIRGKMLKINKSIYEKICLVDKNKKTKYYRVHRLVANSFIENKNNYKEINHKDRDKHNNRVENLEWSTRKNNMSHAIRKVTDEISSYINNNYIPGSRGKYGALYISKKFNISRRTVISYFRSK